MKTEINNINIRKADTNDIEALSSLLIQLFNIETDFSINPEKHKQGLLLLLKQQNAHIIIAEYEKKIVGMCTLQEHISTAEGGKVGIVEDMVIDDQYRGNGIGAKLLKSIQTIAEKSRYLRIQLIADKKNSGALRFYKQNHWSQTDLICLFKKL